MRRLLAIVVGCVILGAAGCLGFFALHEPAAPAQKIEIAVPAERLGTP
ncbi:MAG TPA: hypothetical protein VHL08_01545 [Dongiaceae bacterium]|jgi:hypothetical protein|nr:hypothetical protein [Dongiaceae bacterium]